MKIVVCVKQVMDPNFPFALDPERLQPLAEDTFLRANPADKCAAEVAVRIQEKTGAEVVFVALGPSSVEEALRECLALGGNLAVRVWDEQLDRSALVKAYALAKAIAQFSPDLVLCGSRSADEGTGQTPPALAEYLGFSQVTGVLDLKLAPERNGALVTKKLERGRRETIECPFPAVLAFEAGSQSPRYATFPRILEARRVHVEVLDSGSIGCDPSEIDRLASLATPVRRSLPRPRPKKTFVFESGLSAEQRMELMMSGGLKQNKSDLVEGNPKELGMKLAEILGSKMQKR